ncbi:Cell envelope-related function transcriptional attenuator, LytR/CpsA family [Micromonospora lupini str. Lupac 08]|uniref:Cell envelope-related function transcriptional attenuator, LytR/CpsA family n=2 Tax=Micromonospora lupini TaxID=285679 RepID=I0LDF1_9ACTN|nr:Cell envelope-related function transcriptional attenuator, LytR/CpsA family [Micromonospora lupini str. Lupac 08]
MPVQASRRPTSPGSAAQSGRIAASIPVQPGPSGGGPGGRPPGSGAGRSGGKGPAKKRPRRKDPLWARLTVIFGAVLMLSSGAAIVGTKVLVGQATGDIAQRNLLGDAGKSDAEGGASLDGPIDMLLLGVDARERWAADNVRSDSIIILHIPASHDQAYLISIPRDTEAQIPPFKKSGFTGGTDKINAAFQAGARNGGGWEGGAQLMAQTIKRLTGISFDGAAIINFGGFKNVIDTLGTVRICVSQEVTSLHMKYVDGKPMWNADAKKTGKPMKPVVHKKGCQEMEGWAALDYSRQRKTLRNGDYDRQQNQQQLIKAMAKKATDGGMLSNPAKMNQLIKAAGKAFVLDTGGVPIENFIFTMRGVTANELTMLKTNNGTFNGNGNSTEGLNAETMDMFQAVKQDKLAEFVFTHPEVISTRK